MKKINLIFVLVVAFALFICASGVMSENGNLNAKSGKTFAAQGIMAEHPYPPLPPDCIDIAYDDNIDHSFGYSLEKEDDGEQHLRVLFTPPPEAEGGLVKEIRACFWGGEWWVVMFHINLVDADTSYQVSSPSFVVSDEGWAVLDVSSLGFITEGDFYAELIAEDGYKSVWGDKTPPIDGRSQIHPHGVWKTINCADLFIRAVVSTEERTLTITDEKTDKSNYMPNETVTISCSIKDDEGDYISADSVNAKITKPDDSIGWIFLDEEGTGRYKGNFSDTDLVGDYDVTIYADKVGYVGDTAELGFVVKQNQAPIALFTYSPEKAMVGGKITFDASSSYDPDGEIVEYEWDFGDGNITPTPDKVVDHIYEHPNDYVITLTVMDDDELKNSTSKDIDLSLKPGDLLLCRSPWSLVPGEWTHVGMYIGNDQVVEALKGSGVKIKPLTNWIYPTKKCVEALRVKTTDEIRGKAVEFALRQKDKPYNLTLLSKNATDERSWYCSELVWAAYYNQGIDIEDGPDRKAITPTEIHLDTDTEVIGWHKEHCPVRFFIITLWSPADLNVTDPDGFSIDKESMGISGAIYGEDDLDDDGDPDDWIGLPERKIGNYLITVIPEPDAVPTDTYTLEVSTEDTTTVLAENVSVSEIPTEPYIFESKAITFDTGAPANPYPSIFGTHNGTIKPNQTITVNKLYTYPCSGTGGHTEYARIWNSTLDVNATWNGYVGDWHNITFDEPFTLFAEKTYYYEVRTGSYPQIIHTDEWEAKGGMGIINCTSFVDANGKIHNDWIPAIRLWVG